MTRTDAVQHHGFAQNFSHRESWIERRIRILKHNLQTTFVSCKLGIGHLKQVLAIEQNLTCRGFMKFEQTQTHSGFTRARLAHQTHSLAAHQLKADVFNSHKVVTLEPATRTLEHFAKALNF